MAPIYQDLMRSLLATTTTTTTTLTSSILEPTRTFGRQRITRLPPHGPAPCPGGLQCTAITSVRALRSPAVASRTDTALAGSAG